MKLKLISAVLVFTSVCFAQQPFNQASLGGTPWSFKHIQDHKTIPFIELPFVDNQLLLDEDALNQNNKNRPYRFGFDHIVSYNLNNSGTWKELDNGDFIWRLGVYSPNAITLSFSFKSINLPKGCKLFVMNDEKTEFHGAFDNSFASEDARMLGTELLFGDKAIIELYVPIELRESVNLEIWRITHGYRDVFEVARSFGDAGSCQNNARCPAYATYDDQIRSAVCLVNGGEFCSGSLINNTCNDGKALILTANHCGSSGFGSWTFRFNWESSGCSNPGGSPSSNSLTGGTQRAAYAGSDMSLVEITASGAVSSLQSFNAFYAGWDRTNTVANNQYCVHHPSGDIKKFSLATGPVVSSTYGSATCWKTGTWTDGTTEPGSSGSPLFNMSGQIIGQLYGGPSSCAWEGNATNGVDYYGKLFTSWTGGGTNGTRLSNWLDACSTGANTNSGYDPNAASLTWDAQILSITTPSGNYCDGNISPVVVFKNNGLNTITSITISYQIDGGTVNNYAWTGSLASGASTNVSLPAISVGSGAHTYTATAGNTINGSNPDLNTSNNSQTSNFDVASGSGVSLPFTEGFQGATFPPVGWINENPDNNVGEALWERTTTAGGFGGSSASAEINQLDPGSSTNGELDNLITPSIDLTTQNTPINLTFSVANCRYNATYYDSLIVLISTNCGGTWTRLAAYGNNTGVNSLATAPDQTTTFIPTAAQWATKSISLNGYASQNAVQINFQLKSGWGQFTYLDDINIAGTGSGSGVEDELEALISIYPNPTSGILFIDNKAFNGGEYQIEVLNILGEVLVVSNSNTQIKNLDISNLSNGNYFVKVSLANKKIIRKIVLVK